MKLHIRLTAVFALLTTLMFAQTARVQVIHNSPTPTVDVYANGALLLDNFVFRTATPFINVPAGVTVNLGIALGTSTSVKDTLVNFPVVLTAGKTYVVVAAGVVGNAATPFRLAIQDMGFETASAPTNVGIGLFHGSPDAPAIDILAGTSAIFSNISFGKFGNYINVPANATYNLAVTPAGAPATVVARYEANLSFWAGKTAIVFASGFLGSKDPNDRFEAWVALSNGGTFPLKALQEVAGPKPKNEARLQVIHNSPTPTVDIYVNGALLLDNFAFRTATPYISVPAGVTLNLAVAPGTSRTVADAIATFPVKLDSGKTYVAVAFGVVGSTTRPFGIAVTDAGRELATSRTNVDINFFHGSPDAPTVDILAGNSVIFNDIAYGTFGTYISVPANATYRLGVTPGNDNNTFVARYDANVSFWAGKTAIVLATGFLGAGSTTPFEPWVVLSNGGTFPLAAVRGLIGEGGNNVNLRSKSAKSDFAVSPNPANERAVVDFKLENETEVNIQVVNLAGQSIVNQHLGTLAKGDQQAQLDLSSLQTGYYIVRLQTADNVSTKKLVVNR